MVTKEVEKTYYESGKLESETPYIDDKSKNNQYYIEPKKEYIYDNDHIEDSYARKKNLRYKLIKASKRYL